MTPSLFKSLPLIIGLAACAVAPTQAVSADLETALSGKTIVSEGSSFTINADGSLTGSMTGADGAPATQFVGSWEIVDGQWCRSFTEPAKFAGRACQEATLGDGTVTIVGERGPRTWAIQ
jgi:hypothetical protein